LAAKTTDNTKYKTTLLLSMLGATQKNK